MKQQNNDGALLNSFCTKVGVQINDEQHELLIRYAQLLGEWNTKVNLISRKGGRAHTHQACVSFTAPLSCAQLP